MTSETTAERIAELEHDIGRLRRLLDARDAPGELRHRLRSTLSLLRAIVRRSATTPRDLPGYIAHLEDRLDSVIRAQALADQDGGVDLRALVSDELLQYGATEGELLSLSGPDIRLPPRAGQVLALAVHELAVNAVEHGALGAGSGRIEVSWSVAEADTRRWLVFTWLEPGTPAVTEPRRLGFGTEVLTAMLQHDLGAKSELAFEPGGFRYAVRFPLPDEARSTASP